VLDGVTVALSLDGFTIGQGIDAAGLAGAAAVAYVEQVHGG
jgi:hypothetical protein